MQSYYFALFLVPPVTAIILVVGFFCQRWIFGRQPFGKLWADRGLHEKIVRSLPKFNYKSSSGGEAVPECAICLSEYADGDEVRDLPLCGHGFHTECVDTWLRSHASCPTCRQSMAASELVMVMTFTSIC